MKYYLNGSIVNHNEAVVSVDDIGVLRGYGIFDYFPFYNRKPLFFDDYLDRFYNSVSYMSLQITETREELKEIIHQLIEVNGQNDGAFRMVVTGGNSPSHYEPTQANFIIRQEPLPTYSDEILENGYSLMTVDYERQLPTIKTINYIYPISILHKTKACQAEDVLYFSEIDNQLLITESSRSNFFLFDKGKLITPKNGILEGVTRKNVLKFAEKSNIPIEIRDISMQEVEHAEQMFITSSTKGIMPIRRIVHNDSEWLYDTSKTKELREGFKEFSLEG